MVDSSVALGKQDALTLEYALTRREIFLSFVRSLACSPALQRTCLLYAIAVASTVLLIRAAILRSFTAADLLIAAACGLGWIIFIPVWVSVRGKTAKRTLTVSSDGISTHIGRINGQIPWVKVRTVADTRAFVLIARTNGNAFFIPNRAFPTPEQRNEFLAKTSAWREKTA